MKKVTVEYNGKEYQTAPLTTVAEFIKEHKLPVKDPISVIINGHMTRLSKKIKFDSTIDIVQLHDPQGKRIYESSIMFLFLSAFNKTYPNLNVFIQHSIHMGVYLEIDGKELSPKEIKALEDKMREMVKSDIVIKKEYVEWDKFLQNMKERDRKDMVNLYKYYSPSYIKCYELDGYEESFYMPVVPSTGYLSKFSIQKYQSGVVIVIPEFSVNKEVPKFQDRPKLFETYQEYHDWSRLLKVRTVGNLNRHIMSGEIGELVKVIEALHEKKVANIADTITQRDYVPRLVLIAGPTSSGKTTFSKRLGVQLKVNGYSPLTISMDNYFVDRDKTPKDKEGNYDFEALEAIDVKLFTQHISQLLDGKEVELPKFDFISGTKKPSGTKLTLRDDQVIVIEGIHGLNPKLTSSIDAKNKFKIYISALTQLNLHRHDRILASDTRMIRRIVRDSFFRGYSAADTLNRWPSVRKGEKKNIFPLQEEANVIYNSALFYEMAVLKIHAERQLLRVERTESCYAEAQRLLKFLSYFLHMDPTVIPNTSIVREFIGGSAYKY